MSCAIDKKLIICYASRYRSVTANSRSGLNALRFVLLHQRHACWFCFLSKRKTTLPTCPAIALATAEALRSRGEGGYSA